MSCSESGELIKFPHNIIFVMFISTQMITYLLTREGGSS